MLKKRRAQMCCAIFVLSILQATATMAQSARATHDSLLRVRMVKSQFGTGTIFSIEVDQREYWITAKHVLTGAEQAPFGTVTEKVTLSLLDPTSAQVNWVPENFSVIDPGVGIDIVALAPGVPLQDNTVPSPPADSTGVPFGGECEFLGFPFGNAWPAMFLNGTAYRMPFMKRCTISGRYIAPQNIWVLDGINNLGFSGGPVVFGTGPAQQTMAVISGYQTEPAAVVPVPKQPGHSSKPKKRPKEMVNVNSGFIIAYDISYAVEAIKKNPIGPLTR
jgi:hypothetical protein